MPIPSTILLKSSYHMPRLGLGVYQIPAVLVPPVIANALATGYRHIDCATAYGTEREVALGINTNHARVRRDNVFFTTKLPPKLRGYDATLQSIESSLETAPGLRGYIDLYLIHAPYGTREDRIGAWQAMVEAQKSGLVRSLGVSNYGVQHLEELKSWQESVGEEERGVLSVGQWEIHPWCMRKDIRAWCEREGVAVQAYSPLVRGARWEEPKLKTLAEKYGKTPAQILIRWSLQQGLVPLPKSQNKDRCRENFAVWGWEISEEDVKSLETDEYAPVCWDPTKEPV